MSCHAILNRINPTQPKPGVQRFPHNVNVKIIDRIDFCTQKSNDLEIISTLNTILCLKAIIAQKLWLMVYISEATGIDPLDNSPELTCLFKCTDSVFVFIVFDDLTRDGISSQLYYGGSSSGNGHSYSHSADIQNENAVVYDMNNTLHLKHITNRTKYTNIINPQQFINGLFHLKEGPEFIKMVSTSHSLSQCIVENSEIPSFKFNSSGVYWKLDINRLSTTIITKDQIVKVKAHAFKEEKLENVTHSVCEVKEPELSLKHEKKRSTTAEINELSLSENLHDSSFGLECIIPATPWRLESVWNFLRRYLWWSYRSRVVLVPSNMDSIASKFQPQLVRKHRMKSPILDMMSSLQANT